MKKLITSLMGYENPKEIEYERLAVGEGKTFLHTAYSDRLYRNVMLSAAAKVLNPRLKGSPLIDLGAGPSSYGNVLYTANKYGASSYIGIDLGFPKSSFLKGNVPAFLVPGDILLGLSKVNSGIANVAINGIYWLFGGDYAKAVTNELERVVKKGGVVFGVGSEGFSDFMLPARKAFKSVRLSDSRECFSSDFFLFIKK